MKTGATKLETGSKVAIIGGGPAGSFFALYLLRYAREKGVSPQVTIYQQRNFDELGPKGCKGCAGILSVSLLRNLDELGLAIPQHIIQSKIDHYTVHSQHTSITISNPDESSRIVSIYRGGGPRISHYTEKISFDGWLLKEAQKQGARVENQAVSRVYLEHGTGIEVASERLEYDLVVLASGVRSGFVPVEGHGYIPPETQIMAQDELYLGVDKVKSLLGDTAHVFLFPHTPLIFSSLVPKGPFVNVSVLSQGKRPISVTDFLKHDIVRAVLSESYERACGCQPRALAKGARNYYGDRFVAVGDTATSRLYKDGIGSALITAREAAHTVVYHGLTREDFKHHYKARCDTINQDNRWGRFLFSLNDHAKNSRTFLLTQYRLVGDEQSKKIGSQSFTKAAWGMFTGSYSYRSIAGMTLNPLSLTRLLTALGGVSLSSLIHHGPHHPRKLYVGSRKVLILGSGFGGIYVLRNLVPTLNLNESVETTMVSNENYFLFSPLLHEVATGRIERRHIAYPVRRLHWRDRFNFIQANVQKIDLIARKVLTSAGTLDFDYLVMALGSVTDVSGLDSIGKTVFTMKTLSNSVLIRNHVIGVFEQASIESDPGRQRQLLTFVVSGGGHAGIQLVAELRDFIYLTLLRVYKNINADNIRVVLVEVAPRVLPELHAKISELALKHIKRMGIEVRLNSRVTRVRDDHIEINNSENIPTVTLIWMSGVVANPRIAELEVAKDNIGRVEVNQYLEVPGVPGVYAVGDCAHFLDPKSGQPIPPRAHNTVRQAKVAAHNVLAEIRGKDKRQYHYTSNAEIVSLGSSNALLRFRNLWFHGYLTRLIWLAGYSLLITGTYNRIRIIMDWLLALVFGRDTSLIRPDE